MERLTVQEEIELGHLRELDPAHAAPADGRPPRTLAERLADGLAAEIGSWRFLLIQSIFFAGWIAANVVGWVAAWDRYPFLLLDLLLSLEAAYTAPIILMSQNRQASIDRQRAISEYEINLKAALEIKLLHQKLDALAAKLDHLSEQEA
jgi:uncharacterized membrane protein